MKQSTMSLCKGSVIRSIVALLIVLSIADGIYLAYSLVHRTKKPSHGTLAKGNSRLDTVDLGRVTVNVGQDRKVLHTEIKITIDKEAFKATLPPELLRIDWEHEALPRTRGHLERIWKSGFEPLQAKLTTYPIYFEPFIAKILDATITSLSTRDPSEFVRRSDIVRLQSDLRSVLNDTLPGEKMIIRDVHLSNYKVTNHARFKLWG